MTAARDDTAGVTLGERVAAVLAEHHAAVTTAGRSIIQRSWWTCTCGERQAGVSENPPAASADADAHVATAVLAATEAARTAETRAEAAEAKVAAVAKKAWDAAFLWGRWNAPEPPPTFEAWLAAELRAALALDPGADQ